MKEVQHISPLTCLLHLVREQGIKFEEGFIKCFKRIKVGRSKVIWFYSRQ